MMQSTQSTTVPEPENPFPNPKDNLYQFSCIIDGGKGDFAIGPFFMMHELKKGIAVQVEFNSEIAKGTLPEVATEKVLIPAAPTEDGNIRRYPHVFLNEEKLKLKHYKKERDGDLYEFPYWPPTYKGSNPGRSSFVKGEKPGPFRMLFTLKGTEGNIGVFQGLAAHVLKPGQVIVKGEKLDTKFELCSPFA
ncbi:hypothetical protein FRC11_010104 [Ceratobasidium sp. 423]|nr:hypothetical protein FRC11_010104 [Ceratobasidium sp. 423]